MKKTFVLLISGLSGSGKSTIAKKLQAHVPSLYHLEGDTVRKFFGGNLGYGEGARMESGRRLCFGAHLLSSVGIPVVITCTMGTPEIREKMKKMIKFEEIFMDAKIEDCIKNDPKGMYRQNLKKDPPNLRGVDLPFDPPEKPELTLYPYKETPEESLDKVKEYLHKKGYL